METEGLLELAGCKFIWEKKNELQVWGENRSQKNKADSDRVGQLPSSCTGSLTSLHTHTHTHACISPQTHTRNILLGEGKASSELFYCLRQRTPETNWNKHNSTTAMCLGSKSGFSTLLGTKCKPWCILNKQCCPWTCMVPIPWRHSGIKTSEGGNVTPELRNVFSNSRKVNFEKKERQYYLTEVHDVH